ncbi:hypothetical protein B5M09_009968 [Aphanomyces astaci]|uniref:DIRP domain-containing protein n=1 Tax=Aphanomyces astaci TaxID=112090 RepID=A0A425CSB3_APHAT|nr:hypothetical protein B5M09_009968 [Aphanomyces astaci]
MTIDEFVRNNRGINGGQDLPREYLELLYHNIQSNQIKMQTDISDMQVVTTESWQVATESMGWSERLGPRWTESEVTEFFSLWRQHDATTASLDRVVAAVSTELPQRTPDMVRALIQMHKGFLSLPMATDEGLYAILTDHYDAQAAWESEAAEKQQQQQVVAASSSRRKVSRRNNVQYVRSFSAAIDDEFFAHSEFHDCLVQMNMGHFQRAKRTEWSAIRGSMGHPRRFSATFLKEERQKLLRYRNVVRYAQRMNRLQDDAADAALNVQQLEWAHQYMHAAHERSRNLVAGTIRRLTMDERCKDTLQMPQLATSELIMSCMDMVLTLQYDQVPLPPMVVHKLLDRNLELLKPRAHANMTLYHEMVQSIQVLKSVLLTHHQNSPP